MKPAWDQLSDKYTDHKSIVVADVDCTIHKDLCSKYGVKGYPTIKYFTGTYQRHASPLSVASPPHHITY